MQLTSTFMKLQTLTQYHSVTGQRPGPLWICLGLAVVCGFLISCRKLFTTEVQVTMRIHLLKLGTGKQGRT